MKQPEQPQRGQWGRRPQQPQRPQGLFDLHGISVSKGADHLAPVVPKVILTADGQPLSIPDDPIRATNQNGYTDLTRYQVYAPRTVKKIEARSTVPGVTFDISSVVNGRATVKAAYQGKEKVFLLLKDSQASTPSISSLTAPR